MMHEWGISFMEIENEWDDEQFALMGKMLTERLSANSRRAQGKKQPISLGAWMAGQGIH